MRSLLLLFTLVWSVSAFAQRDMLLGQGILNIAIEKLPTVTFYYAPSDIKPTHSIQIIKDKSGDYSVKNSDQAKWFAPEGLWPDFSIFVIRVDTIVGKWYKVFVNNKQTLWTKADDTKTFKTWTQFLLTEVTSVTKQKGYELPIRSAPDHGAKAIKTIEDEDCFQVIDVKGDWIRIRSHEVLECDGSTKKIKSGWLLWRKDNHLTISYGLTC